MAKLSKTLTEILRSAQEDVSKTTAGVVGSMREPQQQELPTDFGEQLGSSIEKYSENLADFLRAIGDQAVALGQSYCAESHAVADNIKKVGTLEAERCKGYIHRMRELGRTMAAAKREFENAVRINGSGASEPVVDMGKLEGAIRDEDRPSGKPGNHSS